jgi:hypothetical protein
MLAATARYAAFATLALVGPGLALQRLLRLPLDAALVLPLGLVAAAAASWLTAATGLGWLGPAVLLSLDAVLVVLALRRGPWPRAAGPPLRGAVAPLVAMVGLLALTQYGGNRRAANGDFQLDPFLAEDTAFHVGLTRELAIGYPPQAPGLAGQPLGYHLGTDLVRAGALRWAEVDPFDAIARFDATLFALALLLALRGAAWMAGLRGTALAIVGWTLLAADFSFAFAANPQAHWWVDMLRGNLLIPLFLASPVVPGLAIALAAMVALSRVFQQDEGALRTPPRPSASPPSAQLASESLASLSNGQRWLVVAAVLAGAVPFFRVFLGAHLLLGLGVAVLLGRRDQRRLLAAAALPCAVATAALVLGQGGEPLVVGVAALDLVRTTREQLGLPPLEGARLALWLLPWLAASLGLRMLGLGEAVRALRAPPAAARIMAAMALSGWPLGLLFRVSPPETLPGQKTFNDAYVLIEQAGPLLWIFTAAAVGRLAGLGRRRGPALAAAALVAFPATLQFAVKKARLPDDPIPAPMVRAMDAVRAYSRPGDVVLQRPGARYPPLPVVLAGRRVVYERFTAYSTQFAPAAELQRRHERIFRFFRTTDAAEAAGIARELDARLVVLYGPDRVRFDPGGLLSLVYEDADVRVHRVEPARAELSR